MPSRQHPWLPLALSGLAVLTPRAAAPQVPAGGEFRVNTYTTDWQGAPAVAREPDGDFVVVWHSYKQDGSDTGIFGQRYAASGAARGDEFRINTYTLNEQRLPWVAADARGRFVAVWEGEGAGGQPSDVYARRYDAGGLPIGAEFLVNTYTTALQNTGRVASGSGGDFVVVWMSIQGLDGSEVMGQRFDRTGQRRGGEFLVNSTTTGWQFEPAVAARPSNDFVVAWEVFQGGTSYSIFARVFDAQGDPVGPEFRVSSSTTEIHMFPSVAVADDGRFVVAWEALPPGGPSWKRILARRFDAGGAPLGGELQVNTYTSQVGLLTAVTADGTGNFVVTWSAWRDGSFQAVVARRYSADGTPRSAEFVVNAYTTGSQYRPRVASDAAGNFVVAWQGENQDGSLMGVFGQRFGGLHPRSLSVDAIGNAVLEPGEAARVAPSWQNLTGAPQTFAGTLTGLPDPTNCVHSVVDGAGSYGTVSDGATAVCTDCYVVTAAASTPRCRSHWDIRTIETLTPDAQGQTKEWILHVGGSFTDVPTNSPFYRFIEIAFHNGVTGGCGTGLFCPSGFITREQIPVFVLVGKEGTGYQPPACVPPNMFDDVPETSPFCRWIEELARRGVVGGCSANPPLYCPQGLFTREQMAVFILRLVDPDLDPPPCVPPNMFDDVPETSPFCRWIEEFARRGSAGCSTNPPLYCPHAPVTREQITVFISVMFGLTLYGP